LTRSIKGLKGKDPRFTAYRPDEIPAGLHYSGNLRIGDLVVLALKPVLFRERNRPHHASKGAHGFDVAAVPEMKGIFIAAGPALKSGLVIEPFENIHIYPAIAQILGLRAPAAIDGDFQVLRPLLNNPAMLRERMKLH